MNARAETQLRLQETVEGFSVIAISYYAVSLLSYMIAPIAKHFQFDKTWFVAIAVIPVVVIVRKFVNRIKKNISK